MTPEILSLLGRIADALDRLSPPPPPAPDFSAADAFVWRAETGLVQPIRQISRVPLSLLHGIGRQRDSLLHNSRRFASGLPANNALLWGARGTGKSSLVKAVHGHLNTEQPGCLALVEIHREDIPTLPHLLRLLQSSPRRFILFCDDLSFEGQDEAYKSLKAVLEGGIEGRPDNVLFYATSNRRHLLARQMMDNEQATAINPGEVIEEKVSLSDRFGLWLGFHNVGQDTYLQMVEAYRDHFNLPIADQELHRAANEWAVTRGSRSGRVAWQFIQEHITSPGTDKN